MGDACDRCEYKGGRISLGDILEACHQSSICILSCSVSKINNEEAWSKISSDVNQHPGKKRAVNCRGGVVDMEHNYGPAQKGQPPLGSV